MKTPFHIVIFKSDQALRKQLGKDMKEYGLFPGQPKVLRWIISHENCKLKDIADACDIECATASKIIDGLAANDMVKRQVDANNKRALRIQITPKGERSLMAWNTHCFDVEKIALQGFSKQERDTFLSYLERMYQNVSGKTIE